MDTRKTYQFYALIHEKKVFVGKSYASRLDAVKWRHQRGENKYTAKYFSKSRAPDLKLVPLTTVLTDHHEAHRYVLAFIRFFLNQGYTLLNSPSMLEAAKNLYPSTQRILRKLEHTPLNVWLGEEPESVSPGCDAERVSVRKRTEKPAATANLCLRLYPEEMQFFQACAEELGVSMHVFFAILLDTYRKREEENPDWTCSDYVEIFMRSLKERIALQEQEIKTLKNQIHQLRQEQEYTLKQREILVRRGISKYLACFMPTNPRSAALPLGIFHQFLAEDFDSKEYTYPETEDFFLFHPTHVFRGSTRSSARFFIGTNEFGKKTLLRFYPKNYYAGIFLFSERFGRIGSRWLVRAERAADGAMDVVFSLPLDVILKEHITDKEEFIHGVETAIADAIRRSKSKS